MKYWKWSAYDDNGQPYNGVDRAERFELVAIRLIQKKLVPSSISPIEFQEYRILKNADDKIASLNKLIDKIDGPVINVEPVKTTYLTRKIQTQIFLWILLLLSIYLLSLI